MVALKVLMRSVFLCRDLFHSGRASSHHHNNKIVRRVHLKIDDGFSSIYMDTWPLMRTPAGCEPRIHGFSLVEHSLLPFDFRFCIFAKAPLPFPLMAKRVPNKVIYSMEIRYIDRHWLFQGVQGSYWFFLFFLK